LSGLIVLIPMHDSILHTIRLPMLMYFYESDGSIIHMTPFTYKNRVSSRSMTCSYIYTNMVYAEIMYEYVR